MAITGLALQSTELQLLTKLLSFVKEEGPTVSKLFTQSKIYFVMWR
jgi:hypothetical protein